ncbi:MAG TPA: hypothetical protein VFA27_18080 [Vicinamibacterales bacterium]|nr:hypothetical protein [Vicinamibacterales bacterium]
MRQSFGCLALFAVLALVHTWPLASAPATLSRNDAPDTVLNEWIVAWVAHQAVHDPAHLFDANIFYPERHTLAFSEYLIVPAAMGAPLLWSGASPVLVYNLLLLAGLTLTAWTMCRVVTQWTGDVAAGIVSGTLVAFNAHTLTRMPHLQALHFECFPLALLAFDRLLTRDDRGSRDAVLLAVWFVLQGLTSYYALVFTTVALVAGLLVRPSVWATARARVVLPRLAIAAGVAGVLMLPFLLMYLRVGEVRLLDEVARDSATWRDYLNTPARLHVAWSSRFYGGASALYPGVVSLALTLVAVASGAAVRDPRARMALAFGVAGVALSFGPALPGYALLYRWLLPLQGIRSAARFGYLGIVSTATLAGYGVAALRARWRDAAWWPAAIAGVLALSTVDTLAAPIDYVTAKPVPRLARTLRDSDAVVVHVPFFPATRVFHNADYLLESTANWRPMVNGYSGLVPDSYETHARALAQFPAPEAIAMLRALGVTHVWVHDRLLRDWADNEAADAVRHSPELQLLAVDGDLMLYRVRTADEE